MWRATQKNLEYSSQGPSDEDMIVLERTANLVAKHGLKMESRLMSCNERNSRFKFLRSSDPRHALYQQKLTEYRALYPDGPPAQDIQPDRAPAVRLAPPIRYLPQPFITPLSFVLTKPPQGITLKEVGIIKLTAQFVARYGMYFLVDLMKRVSMNPQFEFMKETDSRCDYFTQLVVAYSSIVLPSKHLSVRRACMETVLKDFFDHLQLENLDEGVEMAVSDLHAFVGGLDYFAGMEDEQSSANVQPPAHRSTRMQPGISVAPPLGPNGQLPTPSVDDSVLAIQDLSLENHQVTIIQPHPEIREIVERTALLVSQEGLEIERRIRDCNVGNRKFYFLRSSDPCHAFYQHRLSEYSARIQDGSVQDIDIQPTDLSIFNTPIYPLVEPPEGVTLKEIGIMKLTAHFSARYGIDFMVELLKRVETSMMRHHFGFVDQSDTRCEYFSEVALAYSGVLRRTEKLRWRGAYNCKERVLEGFFKLLQLEKQEEGVETAMRDVRAFVGGAVDYFALKEIEETCIAMEDEEFSSGDDEMDESSLEMEDDAI